MIWKVIKCTHCGGYGNTRDKKKMVKGTCVNGVGKCEICDGHGKILTVKTYLNVLINKNNIVKANRNGRSRVATKK